MRFTISRAPFAEALKRAAAVADGKSTNPVMRNVLLRADKAKLSVAAANDSMTLLDRLDCNCDKPGSITLDAKRMAESIGTAQGEDVSVDVTDRVALIRCGKSKFDIPGFDEADFPRLPLDIKPAMTIDATALRDGLVRAQHAASRDTHRASINGVTVNGIIAASDGHRLCIIKREHGLKFANGIVIPPQSVSQIVALLDGAENCKATLLEGRLALFIGERVFVSNLNAVKPPPFEELVPRENGQTAIVPRETLIASLGRVSKFSKLENRTSLCFDDGTLTLSAESDAGTAEEEMDVSYMGGAFTVLLNAGYLVDMLKTFDGDEVRIQLGVEPINPIKILPVEGEDQIGMVLTMRAGKAL
jgi:DNA polymerase-3 subunit beta